MSAQNIQNNNCINSFPVDLSEKMKRITETEYTLEQNQ
jgi:hypothetical protein